jgi:hypothetical protein
MILITAEGRRSLQILSVRDWDCASRVELMAGRFIQHASEVLRTSRTVGWYLWNAARVVSSNELRKSSKGKDSFLCISPPHSTSLMGR